LKSLGEAEEFVRNKKLVSVLGGNELPSIVSAFLGREWKPSGKGFSSWLEWWSLKVSGENLGRALAKLERSKVLVPTRIFRKSKTLVSRESWSAIEPVSQYFSSQVPKHGTFSEFETRIFEYIAEKGSIRTDRLREALGVKTKTESVRFHLGLSRLEGFALIFGVEDPNPERHLHANIWSSWKSLHREIQPVRSLSYHEGVGQLLLEALDSAVLASEKEVAKWFQWKQSTLECKEELLNSERIIQAGDFLVTPRAAIGSR